MALADSSRYADAAQVATEMLRRWPDDPYAQRTGAALLSEARNGQEALNAAWNGVRVAPSEAEAHLVLALVAARLRLFDLAQRAYGEALDLDADVGIAQHDVGIVRLERRRWARALEGIADDHHAERMDGRGVVRWRRFGCAGWFADRSLRWCGSRDAVPFALPAPVSAPRRG